MNRRAALFALPSLALLLWTIAPLVTGARTLFLRDIFNSHLELRAELGRAVRDGRLPLVDGARAGGQGLLGNPNAVPLYPDNVLLLVASDLWQLNAHFWLHWLLALPAMYALARVWGLGREASWAAAVVYAFSGYFISQLNLYNAVVGVALAPALAAALLASREPERRRWALPALGGVWALVLLGGDPILALLALATGLALAAADLRRLPWGGLALALAAGTLIAAPQWIETLRLLPGSYRGFWGTSVADQGRASPALPALIELVLPLYFGRPDLSLTWGDSYFSGTAPLYFSLAPGLLAIAAGVAGARAATPRSRWALATLAASVVVVYSGGAVGGLIARLPGGGMFRYQVKFALLGMVAASLLAARGLERAWSDERARRTLARALGALVAVELVLVVFFMTSGNPLEGGFRALFARGLSDSEFASLRPGWAAVALWQLVVAAAALVLLRWTPRRPVAAAAALVFLHAGSQLMMQRALVPTDESARYREPPAMLREIPPDAVTAHGAIRGIFGGGYYEGGDYPDRHAFWRTRRSYEEFYSHALHEAGRRSEFHLSSEGLDAFPVMATASLMKQLSDTQRVRILAATGADRLLVERDLAADVGEAATLLTTGEGKPPIRLYRIENAIPDAQLLATRTYAPQMNAGIATVLSRAFDPLRETVLAGDGEARQGPAGRAQVVRMAADEIELTVDSAAGGALVIRRAWHSIWRVEIDGVAAPVRIANLTRLAVEVPPGPHRVRFFVSKRPFAFALGLMTIGLATLLALVRRAAHTAECGAGSP